MLSLINNYYHHRMRYAFVSHQAAVKCFTQPLIAAACQVELRSYDSFQEYIEDVESYFMEASQQEAQLICFPELFLMLPLMCIPLIAKNVLTMEESENEPGTRSLSLVKLFKKIDFYQVSLDVVRTLAAKYQMYVTSGSMYVYDHGKVYNRQYLIDPAGNVIGHQDKLHLVPFEKALGISTGDSLKVFDTLIGRIAMPICMDASYFEVFEIAQSKQADLVIVPIANMEAYDSYKAMRGLDTRIMSCGLVGIKSALVSANGLFSGKAGIFRPLYLGQNEELAFYDSRGVLVSQIQYPKQHVHSFTMVKREDIHQKLYEYYRGKAKCGNDI